MLAEAMDVERRTVWVSRELEKKESKDAETMVWRLDLEGLQQMGPDSAPHHSSHST